jgi:hypothetical protein
MPLALAGGILRERVVVSAEEDVRVSAVEGVHGRAAWCSLFTVDEQVSRISGLLGTNQDGYVMYVGRKVEPS